MAVNAGTLSITSTAANLVTGPGTWSFRIDRGVLYLGGPNVDVATNSIQLEAGQVYKITLASGDALWGVCSAADSPVAVRWINQGLL